MNKLIAATGILLIAGVLYFGFQQPSAYAATLRNGSGQGYGRQQMIEEKAGILHMSVTDLQNALNQGKTFYQIAEEKGIDLDSMHEQMEQYQEKRLQTLVNQGTITKEQMQERLSFMEERQQHCGENEPLNGGRFQGTGMGMGLHRSN